MIDRMAVFIQKKCMNKSSGKSLFLQPAHRLGTVGLKKFRKFCLLSTPSLFFIRELPVRHNPFFQRDFMSGCQGFLFDEKILFHVFHQPVPKKEGRRFIIQTVHGPVYQSFYVLHPFLFYFFPVHSIGYFRFDCFLIDIEETEGIDQRAHVI